MDQNYKNLHKDAESLVWSLRQIRDNAKTLEEAKEIAHHAIHVTWLGGPTVIIESFEQAGEGRARRDQ